MSVNGAQASSWEDESVLKHDHGAGSTALSTR